MNALARLQFAGGLILAAVLGVAVVLAWRWFKANPNAFNPGSKENLAYRGTNAIVTAATGREETFGGWLRDLISSDDEKIADMLKGAPPLKPLPTPARPEPRGINPDGMFGNEIIMP